MPEHAQNLVKTIPDEAHLLLFAYRLHDWLLADLAAGDAAADFTESRAKALLRAANVVDDPTLHDFAARLTGDTANHRETLVRLALHDLLADSTLAANEEIQGLAAATAVATSPQSPAPSPWLSLAIAAFAWKAEYPLYQLDPASPPDDFSPAGQVVRQAATWLRAQVQRTPTERDKLAKKVAFDASAPGAPALDALRAEQPVAPLPPHFRPPIPVRYPEVARETLHVAPDDEERPSAPPRRADPITITEDDIAGETQRPVRMPEIRISREQVSRPANPPARRPSEQGSSTATQFATAVRHRWNRGREAMTTTKLRVLAQEHPDGPAMYGLQVRVTCKGVNSHVAGTTNRDGVFLCELPVRAHSGLTYDVELTWPRDFGNEKERKSITLNADRTQFELPFYRKHSP